MEGITKSRTMIKPNELRIGNLVYVKNNPIEKVVSISVEHILTLPIKPEKDNSCWRLKENDIKGIPITEEWLLKFGFERRNSYGFKKSNFELIAIKVIDSNGYHFKYNLINIEIEYIHQLQNLYFALTQTEL